MTRISIKKIIEDWKGEQNSTPINIEAIEHELIKASVDISNEDGETCIGVPRMRVDDTIEIDVDGTLQKGTVTKVADDGLSYSAFFPKLLVTKDFNFFYKFAKPTNREYNYQVIQRLTKEEEGILKEEGINITWTNSDLTEDE